MDYRFLGGSGLRVPVLSFGTGTFGGATEFFKAWGSTDAGGARRIVDICLEAGLNMFDSADVYSKGVAEEILGEAIRGRRHDVLISTKGTFRVSAATNDAGSSRWHLRGNGRHARRSRARGKTPLRRVLELFRLASDEVAGDRGPLRLAAPRRAPGVLLPGGPRLRMGADAARPWRSASARWLEAVAAETGKSIPQIAINWLLQRPTVSTVIIGARDEQQLRDNLGSLGWQLTPDQLARLNNASATPKPYPYWHQDGFRERNPPDLGPKKT